MHQQAACPRLYSEFHSTTCTWKYWTTAQSWQRRKHLRIWCARSPHTVSKFEVEPKHQLFWSCEAWCQDQVRERTIHLALRPTPNRNTSVLPSLCKASSGHRHARNTSIRSATAHRLGCRDVVHDDARLLALQLLRLFVDWLSFLMCLLPGRGLYHHSTVRRGRLPRPRHTFGGMAAPHCAQDPKRLNWYEP